MNFEEGIVSSSPHNYPPQRIDLKNLESWNYGVILDNLKVHESPRAAQALKERGAWFLFLPKYSPDLNPIEMAFSKLKTLLRKAKARNYDDLWPAIGTICTLFKPSECWNYFKAAGYVAK